MRLPPSCLTSLRRGVLIGGVCYLAYVGSVDQLPGVRVASHRVAQDEENTPSTMSSDCDFFNLILWGVIGTCLCGFGFIGNILSLLTFARERRMPAITLLQCLASSDLVLLLSVFITDSLPYLCEHGDRCDNPWQKWPYIRYVWIVTPISHMSSIWFVVLIALNRYWAVCRPHSLNTTWTNRRMPVYVLCVLVLVVSFNVPRFFEYQIVEAWDNSTNSSRLVEEQSEFGATWSYKVVYKVMLVNILLVMLPIAALVVCTTLILCGLRVQRRRLTSQGSSARNDGSSWSMTTGKGKSRSASAASEITVVLVVVVVVAIACQSALAAFHFVRYTERYGCGDFVYYLDNISKLLVNLNSSVNFVIYCVASTKFRAVLHRLVTCDERSESGWRRPSARPKPVAECSSSPRTACMSTGCERAPEARAGRGDGRETGSPPTSVGANAQNGIYSQRSGPSHSVHTSNEGIRS